MHRHSAGPFRGILLALVLMLLSTFIPLSSQRTTVSRRPSDVSVRQVVGADAQRYLNDRVRTQLEKAKAEGFKTLESKVFVGKRKQAASLLERFLSAHADSEEDFDEGVVVFTVLDDGNYDNVEYQVYIHDTVNHREFWGVQQVDLNTQATSEWDIGMTIGGSARNGGLIDLACQSLSPAVEAQAGHVWQGRSCSSAGEMFRGVLTRAGAWAGVGSPQRWCHASARRSAGAPA
jgi:hypothetical protein